MSSYWMEPGEVVPMETVIMLQPAENRFTDRQVGPCLGLHCLGVNIISSNVITCWGGGLTVSLSTID